MAEHVGGPTGRRAINRMHPAKRAAGDDFFDLLIMFAVAMLVADDGFGAALIQACFDLQTFGAGHRDRLFKRDQLRAAFHADFNEIQVAVAAGCKSKTGRA